jgi:L-lysine 2,3-aminomutase
LASGIAIVDAVQHFELTEPERESARRAEAQGFPISVTPYYAALANRSDPSCPIRRQIVPLADEAIEARGDRHGSGLSPALEPRGRALRALTCDAPTRW